MSKPDNYYESSPQKRALEDLKRCRCLKWGNKNFSCLNPPDHIILDELYRLLLRVTDALTLNLLDEMIEWDDEEAHKNKVSNPKAIAQHLQEAVQTINKCGITFPVWEKKNARVPIPTTGPVWWEMKKKKKKTVTRDLPWTLFYSFEKRHSCNCGENMEGTNIILSSIKMFNTEKQYTLF